MGGHTTKSYWTLVAIVAAAAAIIHAAIGDFTLTGGEAANGGSAPRLKKLPEISGTAQEDQTLTSSGSRSDGPTTYGYQWLRCDDGGSACARVPDATAPRYLLGHADVGSTMRVRVTATNAYGSTSATSPPTATVNPAEPAPPPPPPPPPPDSTKLSWAPPALTNPITINVPDTQWFVSMDKTRDYIVNIGNHRPCAPAGSNQAGLWLEGGHNVVLIGGRISIPCESTSYGRTGIKIRYATGTVHIEGVLIDNSGGYLTDGVAISAPEATVQLENLRVGPVWDWTNAHPDIVQVQGGVKELRIDGITGTTTYQGIYLRNEGGIPNGPTHLRRINLKAISGPSNGLGSYTPNCVFWQDSKDISVTMTDFYIDNSAYPTRLFRDIANPGWNYVNNGDTTRRATLSSDGTYMTWSNSNISGALRNGAPPTGDFVPSGVAGQSYVSPGYG